MKAVSQIVATLSRVPGVIAAMVVGAVDGLIVETSAMMGAPGATDTRKHTAALAAYLYSKVTRASQAARLGNPAFMRLEAEDYVDGKEPYFIVPSTGIEDAGVLTRPSPDRAGQRRDGRTL